MNRIAVIVLSLTFGTVGLAQAQGTVIDITGGGASKTRIAVPAFAAAPGAEQSALELAEVIRYDLDFQGEYEVMGPASCPPTAAGATQFDANVWSTSSAEYVVMASITPQADGLVAECRLYSIADGQEVMGKRLTARKEWGRFMAHQLSDQIVLQLTGTLGCATSQIVFSGAKGAEKEIYIMDYDGYNIKQLTHHAGKSTGKAISILPAISPDGNKIAYVSYKDRYPFLYILEVRTGVSTPLSKDVGLNASPGWMPDSRTLGIVLSKDANAEIYRINSDGSGKQRITNDTALDTSPAYSPDGGLMAFVSDRQGKAQVFLMPSSGGQARRLTYQGGASYNPDFSPDGKWIAYVAERPGDGFEIYVVSVDGGTTKALTSSAGSNESPSWSPDSRHVVFASTRNGRSELWAATLDGGENRQIPHLNIACQGPSWGPRRN